MVKLDTFLSSITGGGGGEFTELIDIKSNAPFTFLLKHRATLLIGQYSTNNHVDITPRQTGHKNSKLRKDITILTNKYPKSNNLHDYTSGSILPKTLREKTYKMSPSIRLI